MDMVIISNVMKSRPKRVADFYFCVRTIVLRFSYCWSLAISDGLVTSINRQNADYFKYLLYKFILNNI